MNREIRFRAWIKKHSCIITQNDYYDLSMVSNGNGFGIVDHEKDGMWLKDDEFTIMQYTGLKDRNGVEIYEGDVVKCSYGIGKVQYNDNIAAFLVCWIYDTEANSEFLGLERKMRRCREDDEAFEVIGNIYQNPELLNPTTS